MSVLSDFHTREVARRDAIAARMAREKAVREYTAKVQAEVAARATVAPVNAEQRSANPMRPQRFADVIGQDSARTLMQAAIKSGRLDHVLLVGPSGTGKSTFATVIANEAGVRCFQVSAPVSHDTLTVLRTQMRDGDVLFVDEIHQQAIAERRGRETVTGPEQMYSVMEDRRLLTATGVLPFPKITVIGATTDPGRLPDAFVNRFPLQPRLVAYGLCELEEIARRNAATLGLQMTPSAARAIAAACRGVPREVNNLVRNCELFAHGVITPRVVDKVLKVNHITPDGLDYAQQRMLTYLLSQKRTLRGGEERYQASVGSIATACGFSRDVKVIQLRVEPLLIERGYVQVAHGGRVLTETGVQRAQELMA